MRIRAILATFVLAAVLPAPARAAGVPGICQDGVLPGGALSRICIPSSGWNGSLVVYAHGYVAFNEPLDFYHLTLPDGTNLPTVVQTLGFAFATTSYRNNGLVAVDAVDDVKQLVESFPTVAGRVADHVYVAGVSEGGLVTALAAERLPDMITGALSTCGPIGSFRGQVNYIGDLRVLFDVYFPGVIPGSPVDIPPDVIANWDSQYAPAITAAVNANPAAAMTVLRIAHVPFDPNDPSTVARSMTEVLWYDVFGTNDASAKLGGNPYDNPTRWYSGSGHDLLLNLLVERFAAAPSALTALEPYETSGQLTIPMVTLHTLGDDVIPFGHELLYAAKARLSGRGKLIQLPVAAYGHCNFSGAAAVSAFLLLLTLP